MRGEVSSKASDKIEADECNADDLIPLFHALHERLKESHLLTDISPSERLW